MRSNKNKKKVIWAGIVILILVSVLIGVRSYILNRVKTAIQQKIQAMNETDFNIRYDSIYVNWTSNNIRVENLVIEKDAYDTTCIYPEFISAKTVEVQGLSLYSIVASYAS